MFILTRFSKQLDIRIACIVIASLLFTLLGLVAMICRCKKKYLYLGIIFDDRVERRALEMENKAKGAAFLKCNVLLFVLVLLLRIYMLLICKRLYFILLVVICPFRG